MPKFLRRVDTALKKIGINERIPYSAPLIQFSSWMGGDRDGSSYTKLCISCVTSIFVILPFLIEHIGQLVLHQTCKGLQSLPFGPYFFISSLST